MGIKWKHIIRRSQIWCHFVYYVVWLSFVNIIKENIKDKFSQLYEVQMLWNFEDAFNSTQYTMLKSSLKSKGKNRHEHIGGDNRIK